MAKSEWLHEWPRERGLYWFYGWFFRSQEGKPELSIVKVRGTADRNNFVYIADGHFIYAAEGAKGLWLKAELPELPELGQEERKP